MQAAGSRLICLSKRSGVDSGSLPLGGMIDSRHPPCCVVSSHSSTYGEKREHRDPHKRGPDNRDIGTPCRSSERSLPLCVRVCSAYAALGSSYPFSRNVPDSHTASLLFSQAIFEKTSGGTTVLQRKNIIAFRFSSVPCDANRLFPSILCVRAVREPGPSTLPIGLPHGALGVVLSPLPGALGKFS